MTKSRGSSQRSIAAAVMLMVVAACSGGGRSEEVVVSAAASLADAFGEIEAAFEGTRPGVEVVLNVGGSSALREQILEGAPVDVFAPADRSNMEGVVGAGLVVGSPRLFAVNELVIAVPPGNPAGVTGLDDFARAELLIGLCAEQVPCGSLARQVLRRASVEPMVDTNEPDVRALLTKVEGGELDAGLVYLTDVASAAGAVDGVAIPPQFNVTAEYPIAVLSNGSARTAAGRFVEFVLSEEGRRILMAYGFGTP